MKLILLLLLSLLLFGCDKNHFPVPDCDPNPCADTACQPENCDTPNITTDSTFLGLDTLWNSRLPDYSIIRQMIDANQNLVISAANANSYELLCIRKSDGGILWKFSEPIVDYFADIHYHDASNTLIAQRWNRVVAINCETGEMISNHQPEPFNAGGTYGKLLGEYYYIPVLTESNNIGGAIRAHISNSEHWEWAYKTHKDSLDGIEPHTDSYNLWIHPQSGDEILLLQHRMAFPRKRIDLVAYNMTADSLYWWHPNIAPEGNSNINQIDIFQDKAIFFSVRNTHCVDMLTGTILWQSNFEENAERTFLFASATEINNTLMIANGKITDEPPYGFFYMNLVDPETGNIRREFEGINATSFYPHGNYVFLNGKNRCYDAVDQQFLWNDNIEQITHGINHAVFDSDRGIYYGTYLFRQNRYIAAWKIPHDWL